MKILAHPKSEVDIIPFDTTIPRKTFTYYLGDPYPSQAMGEHIQSLNRACSISRKIFSPLLELTSREYQSRKDEQDKIKALSGGLTLPYKEDILVDNYRFKGCEIKTATKQADGTFHCEIAFDSIEKMD